MMKFFALVALAMFATTNATTTAVTAASVTRGTSLVQAAAPGTLVISFTATTIVPPSGTVKLTPATKIFTADDANTLTQCTSVSTSGSATGANQATLTAAISLTSTAQIITISLGATADDDQYDAGDVVVITCADTGSTNMVVNPAALTAFTFGLETSTDATVVAATGYTITAGFKDFTATRASLVTGVAPGNLVVTLTPLVLIGNSGATPAGTIILTPSKQFFDGNTAGGTATTCTVVTDPVTGAVPELTAAVTGHGTAQVLTLSMGSKVTDTIAVDEVATITCTGNMAVVNGAAASTVTFAVKTSGDATGLTAQAGYLIASASAASATAGVSMLTMLALAGVAMRQ